MDIELGFLLLRKKMYLVLTFIHNEYETRKFKKNLFKSHTFLPYNRRETWTRHTHNAEENIHVKMRQRLEFRSHKSRDTCVKPPDARRGKAGYPLIALGGSMARPTP